MRENGPFDNEVVQYNFSWKMTNIMTSIFFFLSFLAKIRVQVSYHIFRS